VNNYRPVSLTNVVCKVMESIVRDYVMKYFLDNDSFSNRQYYYYYYYSMALLTLSGTAQVSQYQKVHFAIFWIFWCKMKITQQWRSQDLISESRPMDPPASYTTVLN